MKHVAVLMGGWSSERQVSLWSGTACADALDRTGRYKVSRVDVDREIAATLRALKPDCALNVLHGRPGEDGTIQGMLEILGIPYSHSGVMASSVAIQKDIAKAVLKAAGIPVPGGRLVSRHEAAKAHVLPPPYVIKPVAEGSSVGVFIVREDHAHPPQELTRDDWTYGEKVLVEPYIAGKELTCAVLGDRLDDIGARQRMAFGGLAPRHHLALRHRHAAGFQERLGQILLHRDRRRQNAGRHAAGPLAPSGRWRARD
jgi:D-alanine-D-alanine ligase